MISLWFILTFIIINVNADVYLHFPPGSNNRVNERTAARANPNNAFDSQNNNKGGYNVPDATNVPYNQNETLQYYLKFFQSGSTGKTILRFVWTSQHGCGGNEQTNPTKQTCDMIIQYMCQDNDFNTELDKFRNGIETTSQTYTPTKTSDQDGKLADVRTTRRLHETWDYYDRCYIRERNKGLFTADRNLKGNTAIYTRQNDQGQKYGYECPEERDYWPYISPWSDIAILTSNTSRCDFYQKESFNVKSRYECLELKNNVRIASKYNNQENCTKNDGKWLEVYSYLEKASNYKSKSACEKASSNRYQYKWTIPHDTTDLKEECLVLHPQQGPSCHQASWSRSNYLGLNSQGEPLSYDWVLPSFPSNKIKRCIARIRYNISTFDYDLYKIDSTSNGRGKSPINNNPILTVDKDIRLQINLNTDETGRTFQDRTHIFEILPRPNGVDDNVNIYNWNMLGKRGNIVQTYPAVEYDFTPRNLEINRNDLIHVQWTGSNTHHNVGQSDGQEGDDGQGQKGTDRSNLVQIRNRDENYPFPFEQTTFWNNVNVLWSPMDKSNDKIRKDDLALYFASSGYYRCQRAADCTGKNNPYTIETQTKPLDSLLDIAPASFEGALLRVNPGTYHLMCTRNNNFSNRAQKGTLNVT